MFRPLYVPVLVLTTGACATVAGVRKAPLNAGEAAFYPHPAHETVEAARRALVEEGVALKADSQADTATIILGTTGGSFFSYGEIVRVVVTQTGQGNAMVRALSRPRMATNFLATDRAVPVLQRMDGLLGGPIPGPGIRARAWLADTLAPPAIGAVVGWPRDTVTLEMGAHVARRIAVIDIRRMDFQRGRAHHGTTGCVLGALSGIVAGVLIGPGMVESRELRSQSAFYAAVLFGTTGAVVGGAIGRAITQDRWVPAPWPPGAAAVASP